MFTSYSGATTLTLLIYLFAHYARISEMYLEEDDRNIWKTYNPNEPFEILYTRQNKCIDYATAVGEAIT